MTLENPGSIGVGKPQIRLGGQSDPKNKAPMKMFNLISVGERAGSGVSELFSVWKNKEWNEPIIEERFDPDRPILKISFVKNSINEQLPKKDNQKNKCLLRKDTLV